MQDASKSYTRITNSGAKYCGDIKKRTVFDKRFVDLRLTMADIRRLKPELGDAIYVYNDVNDEHRYVLVDDKMLEHIQTAEGNYHGLTEFINKNYHAFPYISHVFLLRK